MDIAPDPGDDESWRVEAACLGMDTAMFFPSTGESTHPDAVGACHRCPVRAECLEDALATHERYGIWGGASERERRRILRRRNGPQGIDGPPGPGIRVAPGTTPAWRPHRSTAEQAARAEREANTTGPPNRSDSTRPAAEAMTDPQAMTDPPAAPRRRARKAS